MNTLKVGDMVFVLSVYGENKYLYGKIDKFFIDKSVKIHLDKEINYYDCTIKAVYRQQDRIWRSVVLCA